MCFAVGSTHLVDTRCWREPGTAVPPMGVHRSIRPSPRGSRRAGPLPQATARRDRLRCGGGRDPTFSEDAAAHAAGRAGVTSSVDATASSGAAVGLRRWRPPTGQVARSLTHGRRAGKPACPCAGDSGAECQHVITSKDAAAGVSGPTQPPGTRTNDRARVAVRPAGYRTSSMGSYRRPGARDVVTPASLVRRRYTGRRPRWNPRS